MFRFFLQRENIHGNRGAIRGAELEHLRKALRLKPGHRIAVFDDNGWEHDAIILSVDARRCEIEIIRSYQTQRESPLAITLALGLTKGEKMDFAIEKATELGVHTVAPFVSAFAVPRLDERKISKRAERWRKIALSAAKQCGRSRIPEIQRLCDYRDVITTPRSGVLKLLFMERGERRTLAEIRAAESDARAILLVAGPEGGLSGEEAELGRQNGFCPVTLGPRVLRAESAAVAAVALAQFLWGDMG